MDLSEYQGGSQKRPFSFPSEKRKGRRSRSKNKNTPEEFRKHLRSFFITVAVLFMVNLFNFEGHWWVFYVIFFWGIAVVNHYYDTFGKNKKLSGIFDLDSDHIPTYKEQGFDLNENSPIYEEHNKQSYNGYE